MCVYVYVWMHVFVCLCLCVEWKNEVNKQCGHDLLYDQIVCVVMVWHTQIIIYHCFYCIPQREIKVSLCHWEP